MENILCSFLQKSVAGVVFFSLQNKKVVVTRVSLSLSRPGPWKKKRKKESGREKEKSRAGGELPFFSFFFFSSSLKPPPPYSALSLSLLLLLSLSILYLSSPLSLSLFLSLSQEATEEGEEEEEETNLERHAADLAEVGNQVRTRRVGQVFLEVLPGALPGQDSLGAVAEDGEHREPAVLELFFCFFCLFVKGEG